MRHTNTPEDAGWYWVGITPEHADGWSMAYWDADANIPTLYTYSPELLSLYDVRAPVVSRWRECDDVQPHKWIDLDTAGSWSGPECWIGPLNVPGGPFGGCIVEADEDLHATAHQRNGVIVIEHRDYTHCNASGGTATVVRVVEDQRHDVQKCRSKE